jgi:hypothetical protein
VSDPVTAAADGSPDPRSGMVAALAALREARTAHEWPVETDDGLDYSRCTCGTSPPYSPGGCETGFWWADHHDGALVAAILAALAPTVERLLAEGRAEALEGAARRMLNTVDPLLPGHEARMACVRVLREGGDR